MKTYILLFRGINVGGNNIIKMKDLVRLLEHCGYSNPQSYIQSGNVVLRSRSKPADKIRNLIEQEFGFKPALLAIEQSQFDSAVEQNPYETEEGKTVHFFFCASKPKTDDPRIEELKAADESLLIRGSVAYLHAPSGIGRSKLAARLETLLAVPVTARNLNTIHRLQEIAKRTNEPR